jgi:hypothetical protein
MSNPFFFKQLIWNLIQLTLIEKKHVVFDITNLLFEVKIIHVTPFE